MILNGGKSRGPDFRTVVPAFLLALVCILSGAASAAELLDVRFGAWEADKTRIVFDLSDSVEYAISGDAQGFGRLVVDFKGISASASEKKGEGHIARYSIAPNGEAGTRATLDLGRTAKIKDHFLLPPKPGVSKARLVIDIATADKQAFLASLPQRYGDLTAVLESVTEPTKAASRPDEPPIIVIDAGHGGNDPGAIGQNGIREKDVTLAAAKELSELLQKKGRYRIVLTRAGDTRISLPDRSEAARTAGADLFISLHADAHHDSDLRGGSVYTLSEKGGERSAREARSQGDYKLNDTNLADEDPVLGDILFNVTQRENKNSSSHFASILVSDLAGVTPLVNNSHRTADLFVLLAPDVPAVLFELAFISNKSDETNLNSPTWREKTMTAVAEAIDQYFEETRPIRQAANAAKGAH